MRINSPKTSPAFSLIELMIAIVILGLGLVMVGTIFPVAWQRARDMSEITIQEAIIPAVESTVRGLVPVAEYGTEDCDSRTPTPPPDLPASVGCVQSAGLAGDLIFASQYWPVTAPPLPPGRIIAFSDTRVHALHLENVQFQPQALISEDPWRLEGMPLLDDDTNPNNDAAWPALRYDPRPNNDTYFGPRFDQLTYHTPRVWFGQRLYPPLGRRADVDAQGVFSTTVTAKARKWDEQFESRRFCWAVFHRLRNPVGPNVGAVRPPRVHPSNPLATGPSPLPGDGEYEREAGLVADEPRTFDMYYVALRRSKATNRYARQRADDVSLLPDPYNFGLPPVVPEADVPDTDVMLPVPWRVQITVPNTLALAADATGIPTEILVPPANFPGGEDAQRMLVQMIPSGTHFIDEVNGQVYKVTKRRIVDDTGTLAVLTLDREITVEDVDLLELDDTGQNPDPRCQTCIVGVADPQELLRTVWVFPPSADPREDESENYPFFGGPSPVVAIDVRSLTLRP